MVWIWAMWVSVGLAIAGMVLAVLAMLGVPLPFFELTTGGYLRGAQTLLLFVVALYCLKKSL